MNLQSDRILIQDQTAYLVLDEPPEVGPIHTFDVECPHPNPTEPRWSGSNYGHHGTQWCHDCKAWKDVYTAWSPISYRLVVREVCEVRPPGDNPDEGSYEGPAHVAFNPDSGAARYWPAWSGSQEWDDGHDITLPPAAEPGMYLAICTVLP